jgi:hypothetical protein
MGSLLARVRIKHARDVVGVGALLFVLPFACGSPEYVPPARNEASPVAAGSGAKIGTGAISAFTPAAPAQGMSMERIQAMGPLPSGPGLMMTSMFDGQSSEQVFQQTLYPILREHCARCHSEAPEGKNQLPMHAAADVSNAHMWALTKINLRQVGYSKLVQRQSVEGHNCWSDCKQNGETIRVATQTWADAMKATLPVSTLPTHEGDITEQQVLQWIADDRTKTPGDRSFIKYASLHQLYNYKVSPDDMNTARAGISKILNSTGYAPKIVNPVAIDPFHIVYRFDIRDYWGFARGGAPNPARATQMWDRMLKGNFNADDQAAGPNTFGNKDTPANSLAKDSPTFPNNQGFYPEYVDGTQLGYTLSRPDVYADMMELGVFSPTLEASLGVPQRGIDSWQFNTVDDAITINKRMLLRTDIPNGYFWKGVDPFAQSPFIFYDRPVPEMDGFSLVKTTPVFAPDGSYRMDLGISEDAQGNLVGGPQAQASEMIFSLPNGLQGYFIGGANNQIRVDAFPFIVTDPRRGGLRNGAFGFGGSPERLLTPASCMACHMDGMNRTNDDMEPYIAANPGKFDAPTLARLKQLYPGNEVVRANIERDKEIYTKAMTQVREAMIVGIDDKSLYFEPIEYLYESAQVIFNYVPTASN